MMWLVQVLFFISLIGTLRLSDAYLQWSKSYTLKAILSIPAANISEPYQVWNDGVMSRVDFYNGMDKLYKLFDEIQKRYRYYKIHPDSSGTETCNEITADAKQTKTQYDSDYLPVKDFKFIGTEKIGIIETHKYTSVSKITDGGKGLVTKTYSVWVTFEPSTQGELAVPVRYTYELKTANNKVLDYMQHDYTYFEASIPNRSLLLIPSGLRCDVLELSSFHEPVDPLVELVEPSYEHPRIERAFEWFKTKHNKKYTDREENFKRLNIFKNNLRSINSINRKHMTFRVGVNHFADLSHEERSLLLGTFFTNEDIKQKVINKKRYCIPNSPPPANLDWRDYGAITSVKDQTCQCSSCYAFVNAAAVESSAFVASGCKRMRGVSEQALIDCTYRSSSNSTGNLGCQGGYNEFTLDWIKKHGAPLREEYGRYLAMEGFCHYKNMTKLLMIHGSCGVQRNDYIIKAALAEFGPLLSSIHSKLDSFYFYSGGVYLDPDCLSDPWRRSHGVTIVGYGLEETTGREYWIIKNSYGISWGEQGYMRIAIANNVCGVQNFVQAVYYKKNKFSLCKPKKNIDYFY